MDAVLMQISPIIGSVAGFLLGGCLVAIVYQMVARTRAKTIGEDLQRQIDGAKREAENIIKTAQIEAAAEAIKKKEEFTNEANRIRSELRENEVRLSKREDVLERQTGLLQEQEKNIKQQEQELEDRGVPLTVEPFVSEQGDPVIAETETFQVMEAGYSVSPPPRSMADTMGALAYRDGDALVVVTTTSWLAHVRETVAAATGMPKEKVIVRIPETAGGDDPGIVNPSMDAAFASILALKSGRPVKLLYSSREYLAAVSQRNPTRIRYRTGLNSDGRVTGASIEAILDVGGYPILARESAAMTATRVFGSYGVRAGKTAILPSPSQAPPLDSRESETKIAEAFFAAETHASRISELSLQDPATWRKANLAVVSPLPGAGASWNPGRGAALLDSVSGRSDFKRKYAAYENARKRRKTIRSTQWALRGIGLALAWNETDFFPGEEPELPYSVTVRLEEGERVYVATSFPSSAPGMKTVWSKTAAEILGITKDRITILQPDSSIVPDSGPQIMSRGVEVVTELIRRCCEGITKKRFRSPLPIAVTRSIRKGKGLVSWAAGVVEVEIDPVTYSCVFKGIWLDVDCGALLDDRTAERRTEEETARALSWCSGKTDPFEDPLGNAIIGVPGSRIPVSIRFMKGEKAMDPAGIGSLPLSIIPSAYVSAVSQATGCYFDTIPVTPGVIASYLEAM